jgi:ABC-type transport system substrate-binding protein
VKRELTLLHLDEAPDRAIAAAVAAAWRELGLQTDLRSRPAEDFLQFEGPLSRDSVDLYRVEQRPRFGDAYAFVSSWGCRATPNKTNFCLGSYDRLLDRARAEPGAVQRDALYAQAETLLAGDAGAIPGIPLFWDVYPNLEARGVRDSFRIDPLGRIDFTAVERR